LLDGNPAPGYPFSSTFFTEDGIEYVEPTPPSSNTCNTYSAGFWTGLGGDGVNALAQDGTGMGTCGVTDGSFFYQMIPDMTSAYFPEGSYVAAPGDTVWAQITYVNSTTIGVYVKDVTTGVTLNQRVTVTTSVYNGATAEAIAERPSYGTPSEPGFLENYGTWNVLWDFVVGGTTNLDAPAGLWNFATLTMTNGSDQLSSVTTPPVQNQGTDGSFVTTFHLSS